MTEITSKQDEELNNIGECMLLLGTRIAGNVIFFKEAMLIDYLSIIMQVDVYGCETWTLSQEYKTSLRVFQNKVLRRVDGNCE
jgi:hypothetical protein